MFFAWRRPRDTEVGGKENKWRFCIETGEVYVNPVTGERAVVRVGTAE
jgi:hypothetical protein